MESRLIPYQTRLRMWPVLGLCALVLGAQSTSAQLLMSHKGMDAHQRECVRGRYANIEIVSNDPAHFDGERLELQRLVGQVRAVLSFNCPQITRITVRGTYRSRLFFAGATDAAWNWRILGLYAPPPGA